jgi:hypothetical protein
MDRRGQAVNKIEGRIREKVEHTNKYELSRTEKKEKRKSGNPFMYWNYW